jgi:uncharacterized protein
MVETFQAAVNSPALDSPSERFQPITPMRPIASPNPLTDDEFEKLGDFLGAIKKRRAINLEEMDGFFAAVICGPEIVTPGECLPYVCGNELSNDGVFQSVEEAQEILNLVLRHWNTIAGTLYKGRVYFPLLLEDDNGVAHGNDWAKGFLQGMSLRRNSWNKLLDDEQHGGSLVPIFMLAHEHDPDPKLHPPPISPKKREDILTRLAASVTVAYVYFEPQRRAHVRA